MIFSILPTLKLIYFPPVAPGRDGRLQWCLFPPASRTVLVELPGNTCLGVVRLLRYPRGALKKSGRLVLSPLATSHLLLSLFSHCSSSNAFINISKPKKTSFQCPFRECIIIIYCSVNVFAFPFPVVFHLGFASQMLFHSC